MCWSSDGLEMGPSRCETSLAAPFGKFLTENGCCGSACSMVQLELPKKAGLRLKPMDETSVVFHDYAIMQKSAPSPKRTSVRRGGNEARKQTKPCLPGLLGNKNASCIVGAKSKRERMIAQAAKASKHA